MIFHCGTLASAEAVLCWWSSVSVLCLFRRGTEAASADRILFSQCFLVRIFCSSTEKQTKRATEQPRETSSHKRFLCRSVSRYGCLLDKDEAKVSFQVCLLRWCCCWWWWWVAMADAARWRLRWCGVQDEATNVAQQPTPVVRRMEAPRETGEGPFQK